MYLSQQNVKSLINSGELSIDPVAEECFKPTSYTFRANTNTAIQPGDFVIIESLETINFPNDIAGILSTRGSIAKIGLDCLFTDTVIEPGSTGKLTFCTVNHSKETVTIEQGTPIVKCLFIKIST